MTILLPRLTLLFPHLNKTAISRAELLAVCDRFGAVVAELDLDNSGYYVKRGEDRFILINKSMCDLQKLEALAHETAHLCLHTKCSVLNARHEHEAFVFSLFCLLPAPKLADYSFLDDNPSKYALYLWKERLRINFLYGV